MSTLLVTILAILAIVLGAMFVSNAIDNVNTVRANNPTPTAFADITDDGVDANDWEYYESYDGKSNVLIVKNANLANGEWEYVSEWVGWSNSLAAKGVNASTDINYLLFDCGELTTISDEAFAGLCVQREVHVPNGVSSIGYWAFGSIERYNCIVFLPDTVVNLYGNTFQMWHEDEWVGIVYYDGSCSEWLELNEESGCTRNWNLGNDLFCEEWIYQGWSDLHESGIFSFNGTESQYEIPSGIEYIGAGAFYNGHLTRLTIPESVYWIGNYAFNSELTDIYYEGTAEDWESICFSSDENALSGVDSDLVVHCSDGFGTFEFEYSYYEFNWTTWTDAPEPASEEPSSGGTGGGSGDNSGNGSSNGGDSGDNGGGAPATGIELNIGVAIASLALVGTLFVTVRRKEER